MSLLLPQDQHVNNGCLAGQEWIPATREGVNVLPCIPGVTQLQEVGRTPHIIGYQGRQDDRDVIVEVLREECHQTAWFFRSVALQSRLGQAAIPAILEVGRVAGLPYRLREYVQGRPVKQLLCDGPLPEERLIALTRSVASALKAMHQRGFVFGCLTFDHLRVDRSGVFRLLDAGLCARIGEPWDSEANDYSAPELHSGAPLSPCVDLYSLGAILLDLATGYPVSPKDRDRPNPDLGPTLNHLINSMLQPPQRRASASSLLNALLQLENWEAAVRLGKPLPALATQEDLHPYPMSGRELQCSQLQEVWSRAQQDPLEVYLTGPLGSGRSRLAEELRRGLSATDLSRLHFVQASDSRPELPGLVLVRASPEDTLPQGAEQISLEPLELAETLHLTEAFLHSRAPKRLEEELSSQSWQPGALLDQLEQWCEQGVLRPHWGRWHFGDGTPAALEPLRLSAHLPSLEENTTTQFVLGLQELQRASQDPVDQLQSLTRALQRVIPCANAAAWVALEQGLTLITGRAEPQDLALLRQALDNGYPRHRGEPYACLALPLLEGDELLGGVVLVRANPFLGTEVDLASALSHQTRQDLRRSRLFGEQQRLLELTRHRFLTAQIRPHFLFNALNTLAALIPVEPELAENLTLDMAEFLRTTFADRPDRVSVAEEIHLVEVYLRLEKARFGDRLQVQIDSDPEASSLLLPTLTLQPLVENAVRHGVTCRAGGGKIHLEVRRCPSGFQVRLEDDGVGFDPLRVRPKGTGVGLSNVRERLLEQYGAACQWTVRSAPGEGTSIHFSVPC